MLMVTPLDHTDLLLNWRGGVVLHPVDEDQYLCHRRFVLQPVGRGRHAVRRDGQPGCPSSNLIYEMGAKADLLGDRLNLGASAFRLAKLNARVPGVDPTVQPQVLEGKQRVQGFNLGAAGTVLPDWKVIGSYTFLHSRIRRHTNPFLEGQEMPNTPPHSLALWTTYALLNNLVFGGGAVYQADTAVNNPASAMQVVNKVPQFWRFDAFASYALKVAELQLNVANLTDELYYEQYSGSQAVPAEGRVVMVSAKMRM